jgi:hypothetical protein
VKPASRPAQRWYDESVSPRNFRADLPLTRKSGPSKVHTEDAALTRYLVRALKEAPAVCALLSALSVRADIVLTLPNDFIEDH